MDNFNNLSNYQKIQKMISKIKLEPAKHVTKSMMKKMMKKYQSKECYINN